MVKLIISCLFAAAVSFANAQSSSITYSVITAPEAPSSSVVVVVDDQEYPLSPNSEGLLYSGVAPVSQNGYHYVIKDVNNQVSASEPFWRAPVQENTVHEFFNRSVNIHNIQELPQIYPPLPVINRIESQLHNLQHIPTIHIWGNETAVEELHANQTVEIDVPLSVTYYGLSDIKQFNNVEISLGGRSSRYSSKVSYNLKMKTKGTDNLYGFKKLKLRALAFDPSYVRERLIFSAIKSVGIPSSDFSYARLFINKKPVGLFGLIETFQDPWLANELANGNSKYKSGNLYQGLTMAFSETGFVLSDLSYHGTNSTLYALGQYKIKAGTDKDYDNLGSSYTELQDFTKFVSEATENTSATEWEQRLDTESFIRSMAIENLFGLCDAYTTMADNYYIYSDPERSGRMIYIPSDFDSSIGIASFNISELLSGNYTAFPGFTMRPLINKLFANPVFLDSFEEKLFNLSQTLINPTVINPFIDSIVEAIYPDIEWDQSLPRVAVNVELDQLALALTIPGFLDMLPPGFAISFNNITETFNSSLNGPPIGVNLESVRGFLSTKSSNILSFFGQSAQ